MQQSTRDTLALIAAVVISLVIAVMARPSATHSYGYDPDPEGAREFAATLAKPTFALAAPDAVKFTEDKDVYLWRAMDRAHKDRYGVAFTPSNQKNIGSCVAHALAHCFYASESVSYVMGERDEPPLLAHQGACYGGSRVEARGKDGSGRSPVGGYSDGSTGYHAAKWARDWGVIYKKKYPSRDCTVSNPTIEREMGAFGCGGEDDNGRLDAEAKQTPCEYIAKVTTWDELKAAIASGHPVLLASSQGFSRAPLDSQSFAAPSGRWLHAMTCVGIRFDREGAAIMNSWGQYIKYSAPRVPADLPDGTFWADRKVVERMLASGDCWVISEVAFKYRPINNRNWLGEE